VAVGHKKGNREGGRNVFRLKVDRHLRRGVRWGEGVSGKRFEDREYRLDDDRQELNHGGSDFFFLLAH